MMSKEFLKRLGIVGITFGLAASPLAMADFHDEEEEEPMPQEETAPETSGNAESGVSLDTLEYEEEEEEWGEPEEGDDEFEYEDEEEEWGEDSVEDDDDEW